MPLDPSRFSEPFRVTEGAKFRLSKFRTAPNGRADVDKEASKALLAEGIEAFSKLQDALYASDTWSVLLIFQAMDAAGKDGAIKAALSGVNPQGFQAHSFKAPSPEELDHDFLWRTSVRLPERGRIGVFNRSYYEEVLVVRVHPKFLKAQRLPATLATRDIFDERLEDIRAFERHMARSGTRIVKIMLHVSKEEQRKRLLARIDDPDKHWKFDGGDVAERAHWDAYMKAYDASIRATAAPDAPWYVIPADDKPFARVAVLSAIVSELSALPLARPKADVEAREALKAARATLDADA